MAITTRALRARLGRTDPGDLVYLNPVSGPTLALLDAIPIETTPLLVHVHAVEIGLSALSGEDVAPLLTRAVAASTPSPTASHLAAASTGLAS